MQIERVRAFSTSANSLAMSHASDAAKFLQEVMERELRRMPISESLPITRAMSHYLNLSHIAELVQSIRMARQGASSRTVDTVLSQLITQGVGKEDLFKAMCNQSVEIVLTAHPTQVHRRTLQHKHTRIAKLLQQNDRSDLTAEASPAALGSPCRCVAAGGAADLRCLNRRRNAWIPPCLRARAARAHTDARTARLCRRRSS